MVLVQDDLRPRLKWPLGVVTQLIPGKDGVVRTVKVKTASGELVRSVPRVHDLEFGSDVNNAPPHVPPSDISSVCTDDVANVIYAGDTEKNDLGSAGPKPYVTRRGRTIKPRQRLDL